MPTPSHHSVAVAGCGHWGRNLVRNFLGFKRARRGGRRDSAWGLISRVRAPGSATMRSSPKTAEWRRSREHGVRIPVPDQRPARHQRPADEGGAPIVAWSSQPADRPAPAGAADLYVTPDGQGAQPRDAGLAASRPSARRRRWPHPGHEHPCCPRHLPGPFETSASGTAEARRRYVSSEPWQAKIRTRGPRRPLELGGAPGASVDVEGFNVGGDGVGGIGTEASNVIISNNHVHDIPALDLSRATVARPSKREGAALDARRYPAIWFMT